MKTTNHVVLVFALIISIGTMTTGCLRSVSSIVVKRDGTAVQTDTLLMSKSMLDMTRMFSDMSEKNKGKKLTDKQLARAQWSEASLKTKYAARGGKAALRSAKTIEVNGMHGYVAIVDIKNINAYTLGVNDFAPDAGGMAGASEDADEHRISFMNTKEKLVINTEGFLPKDKILPSGDKEDENTQDFTSSLDKLSEMMHGLSIAITVTTEKPASSVAATHLDNGVATLIRIDLDDMITSAKRNSTRIEQMMKEARSGTADFNEFMELLKPGLEAEPKKEIVFTY